MGSTGEADRKRRHFSSLSPTAATGKKHPSVPLSEEKKLDAVVLQFQNKKLIQKLESQKVEIDALEDRLCHLKDNQQLHEKTLAVVNNSWAALVDDLESRSNQAKDFMRHGRGLELQIVKDVSHVKSEVVNQSWILDEERKEILSHLDCSRPDAILGSCWLEQSGSSLKQRYSATDTISALLGDDLGSELKSMSAGTSASASSWGLSSCTWNNMPSACQMSDLS